MTDQLPEHAALSHVWWIGGISRGGKSTAAEVLRAEFGWRVYSHDEKWLSGEHVRRADPDRQQTMFRYRSVYEDLTTEAFLMSAPIDRLVEDYFDFFTEQFEMVLDDLFALPMDRPIVVEGCGLLPELVNRVADNRRSVYLIPTEAFEQQRLCEKHADKPWLDRHLEWHAKWRVAWLNRIALHCSGRPPRVIETGGHLSTENMAEEVKTHFGLSRK